VIDDWYIDTLASMRVTDVQVHRRPHLHESEVEKIKKKHRIQYLLHYMVSGAFKEIGVSKLLLYTYSLLPQMHNMYVW